MDRFEGHLGKAALFVLISAIMHLLAPLMSAFSSDGLRLVPIGIFYALLAYGLMRGSRLAAWLTFILLMIAAIGAYAQASASAVPYFWTMLIILFDVLAIGFLFVSLWNDRRTA